MFKIISKKKWETEIDRIEIEIIHLKSKIKVREGIIEKNSEWLDKRYDETDYNERLKLSYELPILREQLGQLEWILFSLKGV